MKYYVYKHIRLKDGSIFYIGKGTGDRLYSRNRRNTYWNHIVSKDGGFEAQIVKEGLSEKEAFNLEIQLIEQIGLSKLSNLNEGGIGSFHYINKIGKNVWNKGIPHTKEHSENISKSLIGHESYWKGKKRPDHSEKIKKLIDAGYYKGITKGIAKSDTHKKSMSESAKKRVRKIVKCDKCGIDLPSTHLAVHQKGKKCIN